MEYHKINDIIHITAGRGEKTDWVKNIRSNPDKVKVQIGFRSFDAKVEFLDDIYQKIEFCKWMAEKKPGQAKSGFGWDEKNDTIENSDFSALANLLTIIRITKSLN